MSVSFCFVVDISTYHRGFHGDLNETFFVGNVDEKSKKLVRVTHECLAKAIDLGKKRTALNEALRKSIPLFLEA